MNYLITKFQSVDWKNFSKKTVMAAVLATTLAFVFPSAFAKPQAKDVIDVILKIICMIVAVRGGMFLLSGFAAFADAQAENDGPARNKAIGTITAGVALILLPILLVVLPVAQWIQDYLV